MLRFFLELLFSFHASFFSRVASSYSQSPFLLPLLSLQPCLLLSQLLSSQPFPYQAPFSPLRQAFSMFLLFFTAFFPFVTAFFASLTAAFALHSAFFAVFFTV